MAPIDVVPLDVAKDHLNKDLTVHTEDAELTRWIGAAVRRVERHLGRSLGPGPAVDDELAACLVVLGEFWRTQRPPRGSVNGVVGRDAGAQDTSPTSGAPLRLKLEELLGPEAGPAGLQARGSFPLPSCYPDPVELR